MRHLARVVLFLTCASLTLACGDDGTAADDGTAEDASATTDLGPAEDTAVVDDTTPSTDASDDDVAAEDIAQDAVDGAAEVDEDDTADVPPEPDTAETPDVTVEADGEVGCVPQCDGKACGQDGCGSVCGYCDAGNPVCLEGVCQPYCPTCAQHGTVYAPEGTIPIQGAVVWATFEPPAPFPDQVFCDTCIDLPKNTPVGISNAEGKFLVPIPTEGKWYLVVQKGTFRRVTQIEVKAGGTELPKSVTTLPGKTDLSKGAEVPKMAVVADSFDLIENTLAKLGMGELDTWGYLEPGTEGFDLVDSYDAAEFFSEWTNLAQYHVIFMPCDSDWFFPALDSAEVRDNVRKFVEAGGRLYVTDWSYDILKAVFPDPIQWLGDTGSNGSAQLSLSFDGKAQVQDEGLGAWLEKQNLKTFDLLANYTIIESVSEYEAPDVDGTLTKMTPKVWMNIVTPDEGSRPATVSFQYGCGRGLFSTYHSEDGEGFLPQEKTLAYILFEVAVCAETKYGL